MEILILSHMAFKDQIFEEENISKKLVNMFIGKVSYTMLKCK
jgi:hypothetical protein